MLHVTLVGLIAGGRSGVPRYAAALTNALDHVAQDFPDLSIRLLTTTRGAEAAGVAHLPIDRIDGVFEHAHAGPRRILAEQIRARGARADLLHFFDLSGPILARGRRFVTTIHDAAIRHGFEGARVTHKRLLQPWALRHATAAVAVSAFARAEAVNLFGADRERIHVIHSGPGLIPAGTPQGAPPEGSPYLLYVGNFAAHKNLPFLIEAFGEANVDGRLLLVGGRGDRLEEIRRVASASPAATRIEIRWDVSDEELDGLYRGASMLLLPSRYEGFGFTALEAMARGCPVLASDVPAVREISGDGAMLLPVDDRAAWAAAIRRVVGDDHLREGLRANGAETVRRYSWTATARAVCELFLRCRENPA